MRVKKSPCRKTRRGTVRRYAAVSSVLLLLAATFVVPSTLGDDKDLLRQATAEPYLFIMLDTSLSMSLDFDGNALDANGDDPRSRLYQAKEALYDVISRVDGVRYGFATFNQDHLNALSKHYLYSVKDDAARGTPGPNGNSASKIGKALGLVDANGRDDSYPKVELGAIGVGRGVFYPDAEPPAPLARIEGDLLTFGRGLGEKEAAEADPPVVLTKLLANTCETPLSLADATERAAVNRFPKFGVDGNLPTEIWVTDGTEIKDRGSVYKVPFLLVFTPVAGGLGDDEITVNVTVHAATDSDADEDLNPCDGLGNADTISQEASENLKLVFQKSFLMTEDGDTSTKFKIGKNRDGTDILSDSEASGGYWNMVDVEGGYFCGSSKPFSGGGWEGNYDTGLPFNQASYGGATDRIEGRAASAAPELFDTSCFDLTVSPSSKTARNCQNLQFQTPVLASDRALDVGDMIPFSLDQGGTNKDRILKRLNPNHNTRNAKDFGVASYFEDDPDPLLGGLRLKSDYEDNPPIVAAGVSPVANSMLDFRCWYTNAVHDSGGKCGKSNLGQIYRQGFAELLLARDPSAFDCRRPFFIVISDVEDTCLGNNEVADVAGMNSETRLESSGQKGTEEQGVNTWVLDVGPDGNASSPIANAGKGERIRVDSRTTLQQVLLEIIGLLTEEASSFASAAVPSVQADVDDKIYITQFTPQNATSVWEGHVYAFKKPLQVEVCGDVQRPVISSALWDGAEEIINQAPAADSISLADPTTYPSIGRSNFKIGIREDERRVFFPMKAVYTDPRAGTDTDKNGTPDDDNDALEVPRRKLPLGPVETAEPFPLPFGVTATAALQDQLESMNLRLDPDPTVNLKEILKVAKYTYEVKKTQPYKRCENSPSTSCRLDTDCPNSPKPQVCSNLCADSTVNDVRTCTTDADCPCSTCSGVEVSYVLGDIFHATPQLIGGPDNGRYLSRKDDFPGYEDFFQTQERRRKVLLLSSNDGQVHAFDAGQFGRLKERFCSVSSFRSCTADADCPTGERCSREEDVWKFNNGYGKELFSFIPRAMMPTVRSFADDMLEDPPNPTHRWGVDGTIAASDVFIDPVHKGLFSGDPPDPDERYWRTVAVGGLRRGGNSYFALDLTRPDPMIEFSEVTPPQGVRPDVPGSENAGTTAIAEIPQCFGVSGNGGAGDTDPALRECDAEYPAILWEFTDKDLGQTWSSPDVGAIKVAKTVDANGEATETETRYVAVFGGGWDVKGFTSEDPVGDYLYMVDIETGKMIYKRFLDSSSAPAAPAAVDTDQDGFIDRIYVGTTGGFTPDGITDIRQSKSGKIYRVDLTQPVPLVFGDKCHPSLVPLRSSDACCASQDGCVIAEAWEPYPIFDTLGVASGNAGEDSTPLVPGTDKRIFFPPAVIFSTQLGRYAVAFGTGDRENLWALEPQGPDGLPGQREDGNRTYLFVDDSDLLDDPATPEKDNVLLTEANLIDVTDPANVTRLVSNPSVDGNDSDIQNQPNGFRGWYIRMGQANLTREDGTAVDVRHEKAIGPVTAISGVNIVSTFVPELSAVAEGNNDAPKCARRGFSRAYAQFTSDGRPLRVSKTTTQDPNDPNPPPPPPPEGEPDCVGADCRSTEASDTLLSEPFIEQGGPCEGGEAMKEVLMEEIFPPNCSFASYHWNLSAMRADTGVECLAQIPVCITEKNWKDH